MRLELPLPAEKPGRAASAALPAQQRLGSVRPRAEHPALDRLPENRLACDFCGRARSGDERNRLVWDNALAPGLILAELCPRCATRTHQLVELHGGRGRNTIHLARESREGLPPGAGPLRAVSLTAARGILYLMIALVSFLFITLLTSLGR